MERRTWSEHDQLRPGNAQQSGQIFRNVWVVNPASAGRVANCRTLEMTIRHFNYLITRTTVGRWVGRNCAAGAKVPLGESHLSATRAESLVSLHPKPHLERFSSQRLKSVNVKMVSVDDDDDGGDCHGTGHGVGEGESGGCGRCGVLVGSKARQPLQGRRGT